MNAAAIQAKTDKLEVDMIPVVLILCKPIDEKNQEELVLTPGGFRPRSSVKKVGPNEVVRCNEDGSYSVVLRKQLSERDKNSESNQHHKAKGDEKSVKRRGESNNLLNF